MTVYVEKETVHSRLHKLIIESPQRFRCPNLRRWCSLAFHFPLTRSSSADSVRRISTTPLSKLANQNTRSNSNGNFHSSIPCGIGTLRETVTRLYRRSHICAPVGRFARYLDTSLFFAAILSAISVRISESVIPPDSPHHHSPDSAVIRIWSKPSGNSSPFKTTAGLAR